jgi:DNA-binding MarR family transcriptional regulator
VVSPSSWFWEHRGVGPKARDLLDPEQYAGLADFRRALRRFLAASEAISKAGGVTPQQYQALLAIKARPGSTMTIKELAEQLLLTHHAAVQLVDRLARGALATRVPSSEDRRSVRLKLTDKGEALLAELAARHLEAMLAEEPGLTASLGRLRGLER